MGHFSEETFLTKKLGLLFGRDGAMAWGARWAPYLHEIKDHRLIVAPLQEGLYPGSTY